MNELRDDLQLDARLGAQRRLSPAPDEMLFIGQHQTSEPLAGLRVAD
jgi:tryptophan 2,3-dioxygenase